MQPYAPKFESVHDSGVHKHLCPCCDAKLIRIPRRPVDRLLSLLAPVQRFRCTNFQCQWVGNIHMEEGSTAAPKNQAPI